MLSERERGQLRNRVARRAIALRKPNPLLTRQEREEEHLDLISVATRRYRENPSYWHVEAKRASEYTKSRILEKEKK